MAYLSTAEFRNLTVMPGDMVDDLEQENPGWVDERLELWSRWIDARLSKRYVVPFDESPNAPKTVQGWLAALVSYEAYRKRGTNPNDLLVVEFRNAFEDAKAEVLEAANSDEAWFELPRRTGEAVNAVSRGGPLGESEQSPYAWTDTQAREGRRDDGRGS